MKGRGLPPGKARAAEVLAEGEGNPEQVGEGEDGYQWWLPDQAQHEGPELTLLLPVLKSNRDPGWLPL